MTHWQRRGQIGLNIPLPAVRQRYCTHVWSKPLTYQPIVGPPLAAPLYGVSWHPGRRLGLNIMGRVRVSGQAVRLRPRNPEYFSNALRTVIPAIDIRGPSLTDGPFPRCHCLMGPHRVSRDHTRRTRQTGSRQRYSDDWAGTLWEHLVPLAADQVKPHSRSGYQRRHGATCRRRRRRHATAFADTVALRFGALSRDLKGRFTKPDLSDRMSYGSTAMAGHLVWLPEPGPRRRRILIPVCGTYGCRRLGTS